jgi:hypothetical protein
MPTLSSNIFSLIKMLNRNIFESEKSAYFSSPFSEGCPGLE